MMEINNNDMELFQQFMAFKTMMENKDKQNKKSKSKFVPKRRTKSTGSVYMNSGRRSKPWVAAITTGVDNITGKAIKHTKSFSSKAEAETYLEAYNLQRKGIIAPQGLETGLKTDMKKCPTVKEIWDIIFEREMDGKSESTIRSYMNSFNHLSSIYNKPINKVALDDIQPIFDNLVEMKMSSILMSKIKTTINLIFEYAMKYDYIEKNYAQFIKIKNVQVKKAKKFYTHDDIKFLFEHDDDIVIQFILISIYTGMRGGEILALKKENIFIDDGYMIGGLKTKNGINRTIPIHDSIKKYISIFVDSKYLGMSYDAFAHYFKRCLSKYNLEDYTIHSGRHTFATLCNEYELNEYLVKKIMGHSSNDLTKDVYTHATTERLINEVNKLPIF